MTETLTDVGEFGLIDRLAEILAKDGLTVPEVALGLGDDAASIVPRADRELLVTCDILIAGRHFLPDRIKPYELGRRAMVQNISDIGAMGGRPLYALVSLGLPGETPVEYVAELYRGFLEELNPLEAVVIGGNITKSDQIILDVTLMGEVEKGRAVRRATARQGDAILVTGYPGQSAAGLEMLLKAAPEQDLSEHPLVKAYQVPEHRAREGRAAALTGLVSAMIDTSDGLLGDLGHICQDSRLGARIIKSDLPVSENLKKAAKEQGRDPMEYILGASDDYELVMACAPEDASRICAAVATVSDTPVTEIGLFTSAEKGVRLEMPDGTSREVSPAGWDHFTR